MRMGPKWGKRTGPHFRLPSSITYSNVPLPRSMRPEKFPYILKYSQVHLCSPCMGKVTHRADGTKKPFHFFTLSFCELFVWERQRATPNNAWNERCTYAQGKIEHGPQMPVSKISGWNSKKKISGPVFTSIVLLAHLLFWVALKPFLPTRGAWLTAQYFFAHAWKKNLSRMVS